MNNSILIVGSDTDVGKTFVTVSLVSYFLKNYNKKNLGLIKLIQTGSGDRELYGELFARNPSLEIMTPLHFNAPLAPPLAAAMEDKTIDLSIVWNCVINSMENKDYVFMEALGGLGSPVTNELTVADLASEWRLPTILVVPVKLGSISQSVANVALARSLNLNLKGIILSHCDREVELDNLTPPDLIQSLTNVPVLGVLPFIENLTDSDKLTRVVSDWDIELILGKPRF